ncbi:lysylphosphatidylglycerol synthase transmembrane domain-containing protein [Urechidicola vernalis]|uniref:Lysylphosphatidylglycerol synthase transmembrane domain-containing protein n=1 Tax=Urechidicola vernalis TaxID=3075600 RepID=A0ABU2Y647_9FLAO|nr:lysylphosphatidylglycerol synthase transmembrane domain-containing protein [Urechidicola sp. P050]MDT0553666.1 lysylphosphatidylglycerol synthase transmembrane domain-containing protein [Urechidicola sp. P050]
MNKGIKKILFTVLPIALGVFLIWYFLSKLTDADKEAILNSFKSANYWWVFLSLFLGILSHLSRAYRWRFMIEPLGYKPKYSNLVFTVLIAYLVNLTIPRAGEFARASAIKKYEGIPFDNALGTIVSERIADVLMLLTIVGIAFFVQADFLFNSGLINPKQSIISLTIAGVIGLIAIALIRKSSHPFAIKIKTFLLGLLDGIKSILKMKNKWAFIFHTIFIWLMYVLMFYVVTFALPETSNLPFGAIIVGFVVGGLSMAITNGGLGVYPIFVASAFILYGVEENPAKAFGWIMWTAQTLMVLVFGGLSFLLLPLINKEK